MEATNWAALTGLSAVFDKMSNPHTYPECVNSCTLSDGKWNNITGYKVAVLFVRFTTFQFAESRIHLVLKFSPTICDFGHSSL